MVDNPAKIFLIFGVVWIASAVLCFKLLAPDTDRQKSMFDWIIFLLGPVSVLIVVLFLPLGKNINADPDEKR